MTGIVLPDLSDGELSLRPPAERDVDRITEICRDDEVQRWTRVPSPYTRDDARGFVQSSADALST
ncbi:MAG: GNAT family N-acetyltransferase, partial [Actinomycetota bacterium]